MALLGVRRRVLHCPAWRAVHGASGELSRGWHVNAGTVLRLVEAPDIVPVRCHFATVTPAQGFLVFLVCRALPAVMRQAGVEEDPPVEIQVSTGPRSGPARAQQGGLWT